MQLRKTSREAPEVNLTSLIDVVFLLLIFFMISTTFEQAAGLKVSLPEAETALADNQPRAIVLAIDDQGTMALDNLRLPDNEADTIRAALNDIEDSRWQGGLVIHADAEVAHRHVVTVLDVASKLGITNVSIATLETEVTAVDEAGTTVDDNANDSIADVSSN